MAGIYLHIPFCKQACYYCDFHFSTDLDDQELMVQALTREISLRKEFLKEPVQTIYFGGGTPSILTATSINRLMESIHATFKVIQDPEVTLEANPDDLTPEKLRDIRQCGINRLSIGVQSFDDAILRYLNRVHDAETAMNSLRAARDAGFTNISLDLIYAIPGLNISRWEETILHAIQFQPTHVSSYALTIEERTVFGNWKKKGKLSLVDDEQAARQFEVLQEMMAASGFEAYEISNFSKPGMHSRHNSNYWLQVPYLGIGPSAHSYDGDRRFSNIRNNARYVKSLGEGVLAGDSEVLSPADKINEYILTRLRTRWGCDIQFLLQTLGDDLMSRCGSYLRQQEDAGLLTMNNGVILLTAKGRLLADKITEDLMLDVPS